MPSVVLSVREIEVLQCIAEDLSSKEAAAKLNLSVKTVEYHKQKLMRKLGAKGKSALVRYAIREHLIQP